MSRRLRKAGEWKGGFAAGKGGEASVQRACNTCNSLVKKIDCLNVREKRIVWCVLTKKDLHLLCCTKLTAMLVGTNCEGPSFLLSRFLISLNLASSVASILRIFAL